MGINGMEQLRKHVPDLNTRGGRIRVGLYALGWFLLVTFYFVVSDHIPTWSIDSEIVVLALGFIVLRLFFTSKKAYQEKYKELAYRNACAHYGIPGLAIIMAAVAHAGYMNGPFVPRGWWTVVFITLGIWWLIVGATLWIRGIFAFGFDNLALLYVYYPEEGKFVDSNIYSILAASRLRGCVARDHRLGPAQWKRQFDCVHPLRPARTIRLDSARGGKRTDRTLRSILFGLPQTCPGLLAAPA